MTVYEFCERCVNPFTVAEIWSNEKNKTVFCGTVDEAEHCEYYLSEVTSFEVEDNKIIINI